MILLFKRKLFVDARLGISHTELINRAKAHYGKEWVNSTDKKALVDKFHGKLVDDLTKAENAAQAKRAFMKNNHSLVSEVGKGGGREAIETAYNSGIFGKVPAAASSGGNMVKQGETKAAGFLEKSGARLKKLWGTKSGKAGIIGTAALGGLAVYGALRRRNQQQYPPQQYPQQYRR